VTYARDERRDLAGLLTETGPDAPTLCAGWQTRDLAAHLVLRERRPDAAAGVMGGPLAGYTARVMRQYLDRYSYAELIGLFRSGPPALSVFALPGADEAANAVEYFIHHEDVRRAAPQWTAGDWTERELPAGMSGMLWKRLKGARLLLRSAPAGIIFARAGQDAGQGKADGGDANGGDADGGNTGRLDLIVAKTASPSVTVSGTPAELSLWAMGRTRAARVTLDGPEDAVARVAAWRQ
jgi:uncharacterized protein (TIGR03085 family)